MAFFPDISELSPEKTTVTLIYSPQHILVCVLNCPWNDAVIVECVCIDCDSTDINSTV